MLPLTTTTVTIQRRAADVDPYEEATWSTVATGVPGTISATADRGTDIGGVSQALSAHLYLNPDADVQAGDQVTDDTSGVVWRCLWTHPRYELGLGHIKCGLVKSGFVQ